MASASVHVEGLDQVQAAILQLLEAAVAVGNQTLTVGSSLPYAAGIETGHRGGRLARRAGGAQYMAGGLAAVESRIVPALTAALPNGGAAVDAAWATIGDELVRAEQQLVPTLTGRLRASIHTEASRR